MGLVLITMGLNAQDFKGKLGIGAGVGANIALAPHNLQKAADPDFGFGTWLRYHPTNRWGLEFSYDHLAYNISSVYSQNYHLGGLYYFTEESKWKPMIGLSAGVSTLSNYGNRVNSDLVASIKGKIGMETFISNNVLISALLNAVYMDNRHQKEVTTLIPMIGLTYYFGSKQKEPTKVVEETPIAPVTPVTSKKQKKIATLNLNVEFETDKYVVEPEYYKEMKKGADFMDKHQEVNAEIAGHTDNVGTADYNQILSQKRAESVMNIMADKYDIKKERLTAKGYGLREPIADNMSAEGRRKNRRVDAIITEDI